jgi:formate-dependent nitrite reductase membrane component NrfD
MAEHFVQPPNWTWYIIGYFFLAGLAGGSYTIATMLRLWGSPRDEPTARLGFLVAFPLVVVCGLFLTIDLGQPLRFWHMLIDTTPGHGGLIFNYWSPISLGSWALSLFGLFSFVSFLEALGWIKRVNIAFNVLGSLVALFLASYTGVVLSVSNQPVWSDSFAVGGLFVASALSASAALLAWLSHARRGAAAAPTEGRLQVADGYFGVLELLMIAIFFATLASAGTIGRMLAMPWLILWVLVLLSLIPSLAGLVRRGGAVTPGAATGALIVIAGVFLLRCAVIFGAQY